MRLVDQFREIERGLPEHWAEVRLELTLDDESVAERAAALLGPATPGRLGKVVRFAAGRRGASIASAAVERLLKRLDQERLKGELRVLRVEEASPEEHRRRTGLREQWERALEALPSDWSDLYAEVRLDSTDYVERAALLLAPLNLARYGPATLRFRSARRFGYGAAAVMAVRCFERCDTEGITGEVRILHALSDTYPVATQGPVWLLGGRTV